MEEDKNGLGRRRANQRPKPSTQRKQTTASRQATNDNDTAAIMAGDITDVVGVGRGRERAGTIRDPVCPSNELPEKPER
jgi:hypothetical protein